VTDGSGNNLHGTVSGATWTTAGKFGRALSFDGVNDWVTVADTNALDLVNGMTLEAWVYPTNASSTRDVLIKEGAGADIYNLYARNWRGLPEANVFVAGSNRTTEGSVLPTNTWTHLAATYNGNVVQLYVNGTLQSSTSASGQISTSNGALRIGGNSLWGEYFAGLIDEVRIYNFALSQPQIQSDMNSPVGSTGATNSFSSGQNAVLAAPTSIGNSAAKAPPALMEDGTANPSMDIATSEVARENDPTVGTLKASKLGMWSPDAPRKTIRDDNGRGTNAQIHDELVQSADEENLLDLLAAVFASSEDTEVGTSLSTLRRRPISDAVWAESF
jgi:hypothetical protein